MSNPKDKVYLTDLINVVLHTIQQHKQKPDAVIEEIGKDLVAEHMEQLNYIINVIQALPNYCVEDTELWKDIIRKQTAANSPKEDTLWLK